MPAVTTEGLILKRSNFGEADRVLTVLTDRFGKVSIVARGVRRITSRRAGNIELLNRVKLHLYHTQKNYTLTEAESIETFQKIKENLTLSTSAFHILELVDRLVPENQINKQLYHLTVSALQLLEKNPRQIFLRAYEVKVLSMLGFWSINAIGDIKTEQKALLEKLEYSSWDLINDIELNQAQAASLETTLRGYIEKVLESNLKSVQVMKKLKQN